MESTTDPTPEKGSERLEQDTEKENEDGNQTQDNVKETENKEPREAVGEVASVVEHHDSLCPMAVEKGVASQSDSVAIETGTKEDVMETENEDARDAVREVASVLEHHESPCPMVVEQGTAFASHGDSVAVETITKDCGPPKMDVETTHVDENTRLENNPCLNPSPSTAVEQTEVSSQESLDISKNRVDSAKVSGDTPAAHDKTAPKPDSKPTEDKASQEPALKITGDHNNDPVRTDTETMKENDKRIGKVNTDHHHHQETKTDHDKGPEVPGSRVVLNHGNEPSMPDMETSTHPRKGPDLPVSEASTDIDKKSDVLAVEALEDNEKGFSAMPATKISSDHDKGIDTQEAEPSKDTKDGVPDSEVVDDVNVDSVVYKDVSVEPATDAEKKDNFGALQGKDGDCEDASMKHDNSEPGILCVAISDVKSEEGGQGDLNNEVHKMDSVPATSDGTMDLKHSFLLDDMSEGNESGTEDEQSAFMKELENFFRERNMEFKPPKFYGEGLNCLKLWRAVTRLGGYDKVTACKLWRQVGESFRPPKTCTTVSWTFRGFYEKALLEYERHKVNGGELQMPLASNSEPMNIDSQASGSGRARRDAAARAMQGWHSQRLLGNGEDKSSPVPQQKRDKQIGTPGLLKRKRSVPTEHGAKSGHTQVSKPLSDVTVVDVGPPAEWVKINVRRTKDCFEVYALVPGLLREEVRVQSDPAGRLVISGEPENPNNLWGATPFKKVVSLPARIDPHHTSAVVTLNGQLFIRVPLEQSD
ncbi:PREDICTED: AT-rich interactive domain-containing protein 3 isoform X2 [Tarenaya hassleriana]|uniref:AT-rich interactive domain-containing protein 3 isoform X2 n=1 Tax=Tarenaya hassleriana TaxID=28532 RepID=UPI00053C6A39|nr:PREDICTED: AT-rich interactive domain-containing protein 3 isoform X2 [Tarenaya hassleriana]